MSGFSAPVKTLIGRYGDLVRLIAKDGSIVETRAFIQPITTRNKRFYEDEQTKLGGVAVGRYLYIGPPEVTLNDYEWVISGGRRFFVATDEIISAGGERNHVWAVLRYDCDIDGEVTA